MKLAVKSGQSVEVMVADENFSVEPGGLSILGSTDIPVCFAVTAKSCDELSERRWTLSKEFRTLIEARKAFCDGFLVQCSTVKDPSGIGLKIVDALAANPLVTVIAP
jgi:hypothetical protein